MFYVRGCVFDCEWWSLIQKSPRCSAVRSLPVTIQLWQDPTELSSLNACQSNRCSMRSGADLSLFVFTKALMRRMITLSFTSQRGHENVCAFVWTVPLCTYLEACHGSAGAQACDWADCKWGGMTLTKNPTYFYHLSSHSEWRVITTPYITFYKCYFMSVLNVRLLAL